MLTLTRKIGTGIIAYFEVIFNPVNDISKTKRARERIMKYSTIQSLPNFLNGFYKNTLVALTLCLFIMSGCSNGGGEGSPDENDRTLQDTLDEGTVDKEKQKETENEKFGPPINETDAALRSVSVDSEDLSGLWVAHYSDKQPLTVVVSENGETVDTFAETQGLIVVHIEDHGDAISIARCSGSADTELAVYLDKQAAESQLLSGDTLLKLGMMLVNFNGTGLMASSSLELNILSNTRMEIGPIPLLNMAPKSSNIENEAPEFVEAMLLLQKVRSSGSEPIGIYKSTAQGTQRSFNCFDYSKTSTEWSFEGKDFKNSIESWVVMAPGESLGVRRDPLFAYVEAEGDIYEVTLSSELSPSSLLLFATPESLAPINELLKENEASDSEQANGDLTQLFFSFFQSFSSKDKSDTPSKFSFDDLEIQFAVVAWFMQLFSESQLYNMEKSFEPGLSYELRHISKETPENEDTVTIKLTDPVE